MEESKEDENIRYQNLGELSRYIFSITKIIEDLSKKPIQMKKEFDGFCKKETKNFDRLLNYFNSIENSPFPSDFWKGKKSNIKTTNRGSLRDIIEKIKQENTTLKNISDISNTVDTPTIESLVLSALGNIAKNREIEHLKNAEDDYKIRTEKSENGDRMSFYFPKKEIATDSEKAEFLKKIKEEFGTDNELDDETLKDIIPTEHPIKEFFKYRNKFKTMDSFESGNGLSLIDTLEMTIQTKTKQEKLSWIFNVIINAKKKNKLASNDPVYVEFKNIIVKPYFFLFTFEDDFIELFSDIKKDKDFFRKHNMTNYNPDFEIDPLHKEDGIIKFSDFTDDFIKRYTEDRIDIKDSADNGSSDKTIQKIEILEDKEERGRIKVYINGHYNSEPLDFKRGKNWQLMYRLANKEYVYYDNKNKAFYDYFNYGPKNPLYATHGYKSTKILKEEDGYIVPTIKIELITKYKIARQLKSA